MNVFKKAWARIFEGTMRLALPLLPYKNPKIIGSTTDVPRVLQENGKHKALLVADPTVKELGLCNNMLEAFESAGLPYCVYDKVVPNPTTDICEEARALFTQEACDCIVAFGGGSALDCAKAVGARIARPKKSLGKMAGILKVGKKIPLLIAVPTTAGTGSETTLAAVITDAQTRHKYAINDFPLIPKYAVLDEQVLASLPSHIIASTGLDALTHAIEAYIGRSTTKGTRKDALSAIKLIFENLEDAYNSHEASALKNMLLASHYAGRAFSKSYVGYVHALAHALGGKYNTPHGLANAVLLQPVLKAYGKHIYKKLKKICIYCGWADKKTDKSTAANLFEDKLTALSKAVGIPDNLPEIKEEDLPLLSRYAYKEAYPLYPVPVLWDKSKLIEIYREVMA
ncbi:MAG: iron-containing alcohol dehydrogenase [Clostridiales bacterium]|nr:iron-containing alcohol dehydrogenase [Clostridiales bacterium]